MAEILILSISQRLSRKASMKKTITDIEGLIILEPELITDERGFFFESYNEDRVNQIIGTNIHFVQDNHSYSYKNVLRGIHYQLPPMAQGKLIRVVSGTIYDIAVDLRKSSHTFAQWFGIELSANNCKQLWMPAGFGHGFHTISDYAEVIYKTTNYYSIDHERSILWDDKTLSIEWSIEGEGPILSKKDAAAQTLNNADFFDDL